MGALGQRRRLRNPALGAIMLVGAALAAVSAVMPPVGERSEAAVLTVGGIALAIGAGHSLVAARLLGAIRDSGVTGAEAPTFSIGVATASNGATDLELLWAVADQALYIAKRAGGDRVAVAGAEPALAS